MVVKYPQYSGDRAMDSAVEQPEKEKSSHGIATVIDSVTGLFVKAVPVLGANLRGALALALLAGVGTICYVVVDVARRVDPKDLKPARDADIPVGGKVLKEGNCEIRTLPDQWQGSETIHADCR